MRVLYALVCEEANVRPDGRTDIQGVFQQLYAPGFPARQDRLVLVLTVEWNDGEQGQREFRVDLLDPNGSPVLTISGHTEIIPLPANEAPPQTRIVMPLEGIVFPLAGSYEFELHVEETRARAAPLYLIEDPDVG